MAQRLRASAWLAVISIGPRHCAGREPCNPRAAYRATARRRSTDPRTLALLEAIESGPTVLERIVYISTSGVYGDCGGALVDESRPVRAQSDRARRRVDAESQLFAFGRRHGCRIVVLRAPGIYARDRLPLRRLRNRTPVLRDEDDVFTNHIHADDLAAMCAAALAHPHAEGVYNACDDRALRMGEWFDLLADRAGSARAPRIARHDASTAIPAPLLSFMSGIAAPAQYEDQAGTRLRAALPDGVRRCAGRGRRSFRVGPVFTSSKSMVGRSWGLIACLLISACSSLGYHDAGSALFFRSADDMMRFDSAPGASPSPVGSPH